MDNALVRNASDPQQVKRAKYKERYNRKDEIKDMTELLQDARFRKFIWRYLDFCGVYRSSWSPGPEIHFNEGRRDVGLKLMTDIQESDPESLIIMMKEAKKHADNL